MDRDHIYQGVPHAPLDEPPDDDLEIQAFKVSPTKRLRIQSIHNGAETQTVTNKGSLTNTEGSSSLLFFLFVQDRLDQLSALARYHTLPH